MRIHWKKEGIIGLKALCLLVVFWYLPIFLWKGARIVWDDHHTLVLQNQQLQTENQSLATRLTNVTTNAEQRCEAAKNVSQELEIHRLRKLVSAACFNPDRQLTKMEENRLFESLRTLCVAIKQQNQTCTFRLAGFSGDAESGRFAGRLMAIFGNAGWQWKPALPPKFTDAQQKQVEAEQVEQEKWMRDHGLTEGIFVFDKNGPKGRAMSVALDLSEADLADWTRSNQEYVKDFPHLDVLTVWVGYKFIQSR